MRIVCISDTHGLHNEITLMPKGDVLIHAGDLTNEGLAREILDVFAWLSKQRYDRIIAIPGNHDFGLQDREDLPPVLKSQFPNVELLLDSRTTVGGMTVYGSPWQPWFHNWAFNFARGPAGIAQARQKWDLIPDETAILITHGPARGILDQTLSREHVGCPALKERVTRLSSLRLHISGHIHEAYGTRRMGGVLYVNACTCDSQYWPTQPPIVVELDDQGATQVPYSEWVI